MKKTKTAKAMNWSVLKKTLLFMRVTLTLLLIGVFQVSAINSYSQQTRISMNFSDARISEVLNEIENQTNFYFLYNQDLINVNRKVSLSVDNQEVGAILDQLFMHTNVKYAIQDRQIILSNIDENKLSSQQIDVSGSVQNIYGESLPGVTVVIRGTTIGTITDIDGYFVLKDVPNDAVLQFSFVGMKTQEVPVKGQNSFHIIMEEYAIGIEEVVAIGYGTMKKKDLTGSVVSMKSEEITIAPTSNVMEALQGKIAGMDIVKTSGRVGGDVDILLRGSRSIYGDNSPLFIIDGIPGSYSELNPSDIESIDVLKDASSTAIYGSAGSNGVVMITTKRGSEGKTVVNFDAYYGFSGEPEYFHGMIGDEWTSYQREAYRYLNGQYPADMSAILTDVDKLQAYNQGKWIDWVDEVAGNVATDEKYSLSIKGGTVKTKVFMSFSYNKQEGLLSNENLNKYAIRLNIDKEILPFATVGLTSNLTYTIRNNGVNNTFTKALSSFPLGDAYDANGNINYEYASNEYTPLGDFIPEQFVNNTRSTYFTSNAFIEISPIEGLSFRSVVSTTLSNFRQGQYWGAQCNANRPSYAGSPHAEIDNNYGYGYTWENILNYKTSIGQNHTLSATLVSSWNKSQSEFNTAGGSGQNLDSWSFYRLMSAAAPNVESGYTQTQKKSYAARVNYSFKGKYLITFSNRNDGVSWLSAGHKWDNFPAGAFGWRVSEEPFMLRYKNWLDNLKLRVGYGVTGNSGGVGAYGTTTTPYAYSSWGVSADGQIAPFTQYTGTYGNPGLGWEKSYNFNFGLDFSFNNSRVSGSIDWFNTNTDGLLFKRKMPITSGVTGWGSPLISWQNIAETSNNGIELSLTSRNVETKDFSWNTTLSFTWSKEKIESLPSGDLISENLFEGSPIHSLYDYKYEGIWSSSISKETSDAYGVKPGWIMVETVPQVDEEGISDDGIHKYSEGDKQILGHTNPDYIVGLNNSFDYKDFDLTVFAMARYGQTIESDLLGWYTAKLSNQIAGADYWTEDNQNAYYPVPGSGDEQSVMSALRYRDGSFIKIKNITLGYTLPQRAVRIPYLDKCRVYVTAYNPFLYVKNDQLKGTDPETGGADSFPLYKQYVFGVNITF